MLLGYAIPLNLVTKLAAKLAIDIAASPVFVTVSMESLGFDYRNRLPSYDYDNQRLIVPDGTPLIASSYHAREAVLFESVGSGEVRESTVYIDRSGFDTVLAIAPPQLKIGDYRVRAKYSPLPLTAITQLTIAGDIPVKSNGSEIPVPRSGSGRQFLMHSREPVRSRFPDSSFSQDHHDGIVAARWLDERWQVLAGGQWTDFTPIATDRLLAEIDPVMASATTLPINRGEVNGMAAGFYTGDIRI